jgi:hypothetical protein
MASCRLTTGSRFLLQARRVVASCAAVCCFAGGQAIYLKQEIRVRDLPALTARSSQASDVLAASLEIVFNNKAVCCGKGSALEDSVQASDPKSLQDIASKLPGKYLLSDDSPIMITAEYLTPDQFNAGRLITTLAANHAPLMMWNSRLYVVDGLTYVKNVDPDSGVAYITHKFLLQDARFSDARRNVAFDRVTDEAAKVQGLLFVQAAPQ